VHSHTQTHLNIELTVDGKSHCRPIMNDSVNLSMLAFSWAYTRGVSTNTFSPLHLTHHCSKWRSGRHGEVKQHTICSYFLTGEFPDNVIITTITLHHNYLIGLAITTSQYLSSAKPCEQHTVLVSVNILDTLTVSRGAVWPLPWAMSLNNRTDNLVSLSPTIT